LADFRVRAIERTDRAQWTPLWRAYLDFYRAQWSDEVADATFARIFDPLEPVHALVADRGGELIGLAHYLFQRSTWLINSQCYLQDLYVGEATRGAGVGRALIAAVVDAARQAGPARVFWNTHETNAVARRLYDAVAERSGFIQYRIDRLG
jgi:GNAT superfamily N-acetyltransferase